MYRSILVPYESFLHLHNLGRKQRCPDKPTNSDKFIQRMQANFRYCYPSGKRHLADSDMGGAENGRWTSWTVDQMAAILDEAGLPYEWSQVEMMRL